MVKNSLQVKCDNVLQQCTASVFFSRYVLSKDQKRQFERLSIYCDHYAELIPVSFVLGELVSLLKKNK